MSNTLSKADKKWLDELTVQLRALQIKGSAIGDAIAQAEIHLIESGESAQVAFGGPAAYAKSLEFLPSQKLDRSAASWVRFLAPCMSGVVGLLLAGSLYREINSQAAVSISWGSIISFSIIIIATALFTVMAKLILTKKTVRIIFGFTSFVLCIAPMLLFPNTAFTMPFWTAAVIIGLLLSISVIGMRLIRKDMAGPVIDPRVPHTRKSWAWVTEWSFVLLTLITYVIPAGVQLLLH